MADGVPNSVHMRSLDTYMINPYDFTITKRSCKASFRGPNGHEMCETLPNDALLVIDHYSSPENRNPLVRAMAGSTRIKLRPDALFNAVPYYGKMHLTNPPATNLTLMVQEGDSCLFKMMDLKCDAGITLGSVIETITEWSLSSMGAVFADIHGAWILSGEERRALDETGKRDYRSTSTAIMVGDAVVGYENAEQKGNLLGKAVMPDGYSAPMNTA